MDNSLPAIDAIRALCAPLPEGYSVEYDGKTGNIIVSSGPLGFCVTKAQITDGYFVDCVKAAWPKLVELTNELRAPLAPCPLCGSQPIEHAGSVLIIAGASCSNVQCILHIDYQDDTNRHVRRDQWPKMKS